MKKVTIFSLLFFSFINNGIAQFKAKKFINVKDSLELIERSSSYVKKHMIYMNLGKYYQYYKGDSAIGFFLNATNIAIGANLKTASTASTKLIVNSSTGDIYYDADGNGSASTAVKIAHYAKTTDLNIAAANFEFIA